MTTAALTPTSYAVLGLLAVKRGDGVGWTTYELAKQMDKTLNRFWPRARSKLYEEPKKLVDHGLAKASSGSTGLRPRTVYTITARGRRALAGWLAAESAPPVFESEHLLKIFYADSGSTADLLATLNGLRDWAYERAEHNVAVANSYLDGSGPYPDRLPVLVLTGRFLDDYVEMIDRWATWAAGIAETWPDQPRDAEPDLTALAGTARQAKARIRRNLKR